MKDFVTTGEEGFAYKHTPKRQFFDDSVHITTSGKAERAKKTMKFFSSPPVKMDKVAAATPMTDEELERRQRDLAKRKEIFDKPVVKHDTDTGVTKFPDGPVGVQMAGALAEYRKKKLAMNDAQYKEFVRWVKAEHPEGCPTAAASASKAHYQEQWHQWWESLDIDALHKQFAKEREHGH